MTKECLDNLRCKYPVLFDYPAQFAIEDGWCNIISDLAEEIVTYTKENNLTMPTIRVMKQSYGSLYIELFPQFNNDDYLENLLMKYDAISEKTCEICGEAGEIFTTDTMVWTLCPKHIENMTYYYRVEFEEEKTKFLKTHKNLKQIKKEYPNAKKIEELFDEQYELYLDIEKTFANAEKEEK